MKIRSDFVSNSSSSSFILKDVGFFKYFKITKQDIIDAISELYGGKNYIDKLLKEAIEKHEIELAKYKANVNSDDWDKTYHTKRLQELRTKGLEIFCVYDMTDKNDREECYKEWDNHFAGWYAPNEGEVGQWNTFIDILRWKCNFDNAEAVANGEDNELKTYTWSKETQKSGYVTFPDGAKLVKYVKEKLDIKTMKEVLHDKDCTLMIHFDNNEIFNLNGMSEEDQVDDKDVISSSSKYDSQSYSSDRFFEILIKYFITKGKVNLADPNFMEYWKITDENKDIWHEKLHPEKKYYLESNDTATWKDVVDDMLNCNAIMHEG